MNRELLSLLALMVMFVACSSEPPVRRDGAEVIEQTEASGPRRLSERVESAIMLEGGSFATRDCTVTIRWEGGGSDVRIATEATASPIPMQESNGVHEATIAPASHIVPGQLYAYKLVVDGQPRLDPNNRYRKIVAGEMSSAFMLPRCEASPETRSDRVVVQGDSMQVRVTFRTAADAVAVTRVLASLDNGTLPEGSFTAKPADGAVDFAFTGLPKGKHTLSLRAFDASDREAEEVDLPFWVEDEPFDWRDGILYMLLIDRFANGEPANDRPIGDPVHYDADWHGGDLQGAIEALKNGYFERLGVRTIWLSPLNAQTDAWHFGDGNQKFSAYHGYWPIKAREVEPRFGGDEALHTFVQEAHARGLRVLLDLINNQVHNEHEYVTQHPSWFRSACKCGEPGCGWSERPFECMFQPYLPDIDWNQTGAEQQFIADAVNWVAAFDLDGFRVDAVKHVEANSVFNMRAELKRRFEQGGARIFMAGETAVGEHDRGTFFGEQFDDGFAWIDAYTGPNALDSQFDFPTRHNMADGLVNGDKPLSEVEHELRKAETRYNPAHKLHVRFLNGHDNPRIASIAAKDPKLGCSWTSGCRDEDLPPLAYSDPEVYVRLKRALTVLYTLPGVPYLYMGDEVAFGGGGDPDMRRDMLFGDELAHLEMNKPGIAPRSLTSAQVDVRSWIEKLGAARAGLHALRRGERVTLLAESDLWVYAYQADSDVALVAVNRGAAVDGRFISTAGLDLGQLSSFASMLGTGAAVKEAGSISLTLGAGEAAIFKAVP